MSKFIVVPAQDSSFLLKEAHYFLKLTNLQAVKQYDVFETSDESELTLVEPLFEQGLIYENLESFNTSTAFRYRQVLGQYDEVEEMTNRIIQNIEGHDLSLHHSRIIDLKGLTEAEVKTFKTYYINETETELVSFNALNYDMGVSQGLDLQEIEGFNDLDTVGLQELIKDYSMDLADIEVVQAYFQSEAVNPTVFQLKVIDTYWSDHCRHTTFLTELTDISVTEGKYQEAIEATIAEYNDVRDSVYANRPKVKPVTLMDLATINAKHAKQLGLLDNLDESDEVNACCIRIKVDVEGVEEDYLLYFKNETHNHPTEIEPFGGAATCIGGGFVTRFQVVVTFIKQCELLELKTRMHLMNQHAMVNYRNVSSHNVLLWDIVTTVTKSDKVLVTYASITMTDLKLRGWN
ncbi:hypothetical protein VQP54_01270 [Ruoffia tabacinasalis]